MQLLFCKRLWLNVTKNRYMNAKKCYIFTRDVFLDKNIIWQKRAADGNFFHDKKRRENSFFYNWKY